MTYQIITGRFENGVREQRADFIRLFGAENAQYRFDFYFHWYNIAHEYGHCLCNYYESDVIDLKQEFLVNRFAVCVWKYAGYERELKNLQKMLNETLRSMKNPAPADMSFEDYYEQIWGSDRITDTPVYGYLQFKSVLTALESELDFASVLKEMGIREKIDFDARLRKNYKKYPAVAETAKEALNDLRRFLDDLGIEAPEANVEFVDNPAVHCMRIREFSDSD